MAQAQLCLFVPYVVLAGVSGAHNIHALFFRGTELENIVQLQPQNWVPASET